MCLISELAESRAHHRYTQNVNHDQDNNPASYREP